MTKTPEVLYKITWTLEDGTGGGTALADHLSSVALRGMLYAAGWKAVWMTPAEAPTGRHSAPPVPLDEPVIGAVAKRLYDRLQALRIERCTCPAKAGGYAGSGVHSLGCPSDNLSIPGGR